MSLQKIKVTAKTLDQAREKAAGMLGVAISEVEHTIISQTDAGFLSFLGGRKVEISAWTKAIKPLENREPLSDTEMQKLVSDLTSFCRGICAYLSDNADFDIHTKVEQDRLCIDIDDEQIAQQIGKNTRLAESMEHLLRKKPRYLKRELPFRIFVDAQGIRVKREAELIEMARDLSGKVAENQKPVVLNYKSSYDRKIIHMALDQDNRVYTKSIGSGANRKLMIMPAKNAES